MTDYTFQRIVADRELAERCLEHMGRADFQEVLNDCHAAARALRNAMDEIQRLQVKFAALGLPHDCNGVNLGPVE